MRKKILVFVAVTALTVVGMITSVNISMASMSEDCPNGCLVTVGPGCQCNGWHPNMLEDKPSKAKLQRY